ERAQAGDSLYPDWHNYPHVSNFYGPVYFFLVGQLARLVGADLDRLFLIGRGVTLGSAVITTLGLAWFLGRRYGRSAALVGLLYSLGSLPMFGFSVMVRPDTMAELFGCAGVLLSWQRTRAGVLGGGALLVLAILTKQTAITFLAAAAAGLWWEGQRRLA